MYSTFAHSCDRTIRIGDMVGTKRGNQVGNLPPISAALADPLNAVRTVSERLKRLQPGGDPLPDSSTPIPDGTHQPTTSILDTPFHGTKLRPTTRTPSSQPINHNKVRSTNSVIRNRAGTPNVTKLAQTTNLSPRSQPNLRIPHPSAPFEQETAQDFHITHNFVTAVFKEPSFFEEPSCIVGIVDDVDESRATALVSVWKRDGEIQAVHKKRALEIVPLASLIKLTKPQFERVCRKQFMHDASHQLKLQAEGYDESAPVALIAYNNKLISNLIERIGDSTLTGKSAKDRQRFENSRRKRVNQAMGAIKALPVPKVVPVEDPLAEVRGELRTLSDDQGTRRRHSTVDRKRDIGTNVKDPDLLDREEAQLRSTRNLSSQFRPGGLLSTIVGETASATGLQSDGARTAMSNRSFVSHSSVVQDETIASEQHSRWASERGSPSFVEDKLLFATENLSSLINNEVVSEQEKASQMYGSKPAILPPRFYQTRHHALPVPESSSMEGSGMRKPQQGSTRLESSARNRGVSVRYPEPQSVDTPSYKQPSSSHQLFRCVLTELRDDCTFTLKVKTPLELSNTHFRACFAHIDVFLRSRLSNELRATWLGSDGLEHMQLLKGQQFEVIPVAPRADGVAMCVLKTQNGESVQQDVVGMGYGRVRVSPELLQDVPSATEMQIAMEIMRLADVQRRALDAKRGMWEMGDCIFASEDFASSSEGTRQTHLDESTPTPSLSRHESVRDGRAATPQGRAEQPTDRSTPLQRRMTPVSGSTLMMDDEIEEGRQLPELFMAFQQSTKMNEKLLQFVAAQM